MFVRRKKNRSGSTSVVVVSKAHGQFHEVKTLGVSSDAAEIARLHQVGQVWIREHADMKDLFERARNIEFERDAVKYFLDNVENILLNGTQLILDRVFRLTGFDKIDDDILKSLVTARICQPLSKTATIEYLKSHFDEDIEEHRLYKYLDRLEETQKERVQQISVEHTRKVIGGKIGVVFYDVTTLYFETDTSDDLRKTGYSKDGKHSLPQIVLGLLVSEGGYPLAYSIHEGNKYEGHTMLPVITDFVKKFKLREQDLVVVADSGLMNNDNLEALDKGKYKYIIGARIKNESAAITKWILSCEKKNGSFYECKKTGKRRLIVGFAEGRAKKDAENRNKGVRRLEKEYGSGTVTKDKINRRGYNKFLELTEDVTVKINYDKINEDAQWDGWKGYITNTKLEAKVVCEEYGGLWQVERAFRISKGRLDLRPMFHFNEKRIRAHVCICFVAYKVYKELERILKQKHIGISVDKVLSIAKTITTICLRLPQSGTTLKRTMLLTERHKSIAPLFDENFWLDKSVRIE
ncbi:MAG: IS1634 family transposase [Prevotellaceae bacterium]|jgi:transposase|nr:IS1634 family transposase [Prevotellaceae bacterium]